MTDTDRPVYVAVRYVYHDKDAAPTNIPPGTLTPKEIIDRALHPSVACTTIWCPGVANPEPGPTDLDDVYESEIMSYKQEEPLRIERSPIGTDWMRFERSRKSNVIPLTPGQQQAHYGHSMAEDIPDGSDVA